MTGTIEYMTGQIRVLTVGCTACIVVSQRTVSVRQTVIAMSQTRYHTVATLLLDQILQINF